MKWRLLIAVLFSISQNLYSQTPQVPQSPDTDDWVKKAIKKIDNKDYDGAVADCDGALRMASQNSWAYDIRGLAKYYSGRYPDAIADYDVAISINPKYTGAYFNRGLAKYYSNRYADAIDDFNQAIALDPKYTIAYNDRGYAYYTLGGTKANYRKAIADYDRCMQLGGSGYDPFYKYRDKAADAMAAATGP